MDSPRILVAGIGNIFLGDDGFGVEVIRRLSQRQWPSAVRVADFGIRGLDLAFTLLDDFEVVILVDAVPRGGPPGTLYLIEHQMEATPASAGGMVEPHSMDPVKVLQLVESLGGRVRRLLVVGCEPAEIGSEQDIEMGLSPAVRAAVDESLPLIESLVERILRGEPVTGAD